MIAKKLKLCVFAVVLLIALFMVVTDLIWITRSYVFNDCSTKHKELRNAFQFFVEKSSNGPKEKDLSDIVILGQPPKETVYLSIGIPSVMRPRSFYLFETIRSLINNTDHEDRQGVLIVVFLCDQEKSNRKSIAESIERNFSAEIAGGFLHVIQPPSSLLDQSRVVKKRTYNDSVTRVQWRTKQVLDFMFLLKYCENLSTYFMQLEDDVIAAPNFVPAIREFVNHQTVDWIDLQFSNFWAIGRLYKSKYLKQLAEFLWTFHEEQPVDILYEYFRALMIPGVETDQFIRRPALFQHIGKLSSLVNKTSDLQDATFSTDSKEYKGDNPPADVITDLQVYESFTPQQAYVQSPGFFWSSDVKKGGQIFVVFHAPVALSRVVIATGTKQKPKDILLNGKLDASRKYVSQKGNDVHCADFNYIGSFDEGLLDIKNFYVVAPYKVHCLRVTVLSDQESWLIVREIAVFVKAT